MREYILINLFARTFRRVRGWDEVEKVFRDAVDLDNIVVMVERLNGDWVKVDVDALRARIRAGGRVPGSAEPGVV